MSHVASPLMTDGAGRTAFATTDDHLAAMLTRLLMTGPGQRVMRPGFGSGLAQMVFAPADDEVAAATRFLVEGAIQQWLGDRIELLGLSTDFEGSTLLVTVTYARSDTPEPVQLVVRVPQ